MAAITVQETHAASQISSLLSAFGPNVTGNYTTLNISTVQSPVTAFITAFTFNNVLPYEPEGFLFTLNTSPLTGFPVRLTNTGFALSLSAQVGEAALGVFAGTLVLTLSAQCLSSSGATNGTSTVVDTPSATLTFQLTAVNLPFNNQPSQDRFRRLHVLGYV